jgi:hypothetical protein
MATPRSPWILMLALAGTAACSLLIPFNPEGLPCGTGEACLAGYTCVDGLCRGSASQQDPCSFCRADERCKPDKSGCEKKSCANTPCPVGETCQETGGVPLCVPRMAPMAGYPCAVDADCESTTTTRVCARGQRPRLLPDGGTGFGVCLHRCLSTTSACSNVEPMTCTEFRSGLDVGTGKACLGADTLVPCKVDTDCSALSPDFTCAQFAHPRLGLIQACDLAVPGGARLGEACGAGVPAQASPWTADGGVVDGGGADPGPLVRCARGTCVATPDGGTACAPPCVLGGCAAPDECRAVEARLGDVDIRPAACVEATGCAACARDGDCGSDAPHCTALPDGGSVCLMECTAFPDGGSSGCAPGQACQMVGTVARCLPVAPATCP